MRQVLLDSNYYELKSGTVINRRNINPRAARFETGVPGYSSFTQASVEAWKGMRGGIGHKYQTTSGTEECWWSEGVDSSHDGGIILGPKVNTAGTFGAAPVKIIDFGGKTYAIGASKISEWSGSAWTPKDSSMAAPLDAIVVTDVTDSYLVVSDATSAIYSINGTDWSALTGCAGYLTYFDNRLVGFYGQTMYFSPAEDIDGTWDSCNAAGADLGTVYGIFTAKSQVNDEPLLCINASNGLFTYDFYVQQIYPYLRLTGHSNAGRAGMFWNSYIFVSSLGGIKKIAGSLVTDIGPDQDDGLPVTYQGYVYDMCPAGDGSWMVFSVHNGSTTDKSSIFKRHGTVGGNQQIYSTSAANTAITCVHYSPSHLYTNGRLWWGEGTSVKYCMMPDFNTDVTQISGYEFTDSGTMYYSIFRPLEAFPKLAITVAGVTKNCDDDNPIVISYYSDNDNDWEELGTFADSPDPDALPFASSVGLEFRWIKLKADFTGAAASASPELKSLELDYDAATKRIRGWTFVVKVTKDNAQGTVDALHTTQDKNTLVVFYPSGSANGDSYYVKISSIAENISWDEGRVEGELQISVEELIRR
jgi:hypothetical protein